MKQAQALVERGQKSLLGHIPVYKKEDVYSGRPINFLNLMRSQ